MKSRTATCSSKAWFVEVEPKKSTENHDVLSLTTRSEGPMRNPRHSLMTLSDKYPSDRAVAVFHHSEKEALHFWEGGRHPFKFGILGCKKPMRGVRCCVQPTKRTLPSTSRTDRDVQPTTNFYSTTSLGCAPCPWAATMVLANKAKLEQHLGAGRPCSWKLCHLPFQPEASECSHKTRKPKREATLLLALRLATKLGGALWCRAAECPNQGRVYKVPGRNPREVFCNAVFCLSAEKPGVSAPKTSTKMSSISTLFCRTCCLQGITSNSHARSS